MKSKNLVKPGTFVVVMEDESIREALNQYQENSDGEVEGHKTFESALEEAHDQDDDFEIYKSVNGHLFPTSDIDALLEFEMRVLG